jgi:hypothetical protein
MAITVRGVNNAVGQNAGTTITASTTAITPTGSPVSGDRVFIYQAASNTSGTTPTSWNVLGTKDTTLGSGAAASGSGLRRATWYWRDYDGSWSLPSFPLTSAAQNSHWLGLVILTPSAGATFNTPTISTVGGAFNTATTAYTDTSAAAFTTTANGLLLAGTCLNDNVTASAEAVSQSGATFGTVTERCDGGTATGNIVAGNVVTAPVTVGAAATITLTETLSAASQGETLFVQQTETFAKVDTLTDDFTTIGSNWSASLYSTDSAKVTNPSGTVRVDHPTTSQYNALGTVKRYDLTGSSFYARVVDYGNQSLGSHEVLLFADDGSGSNRLIWDASGNNLYAIKTVASSKTTLGGITLNTTTHRYLRIREASGTVYWDTSPDGTSSSWTNRFSDTTPFNVSAVNVQMQCGNYATEASASYAIFDDFNIPGVAAPANTGQFFAMF